MSEAVLGPKSAKYRVFCGYTWKTPVYLENTWVSCRFPQFCPRFCPRPALRLRETREFPEGNSRETEWSTKTPSDFPGNFRKRKVLGTLWFPSGLPETLGKANMSGLQGQRFSAARGLRQGPGRPHRAPEAAGVASLMTCATRRRGQLRFHNAPHFWHPPASRA